MSEANHIIDIKILDRHYKIKCRPDEAKELRESAQYLDHQMRKVRQANNITNTDRIAVVASLNIAHELMLLKQQVIQMQHRINQQAESLTQRIQQCLTTEEEVVAA